MSNQISDKKYLYFNIIFKYFRKNLELSKTLQNKNFFMLKLIHFKIVQSKYSKIFF